MVQDDPAVSTEFHNQPVELLQELIRFETVNPPGNERPCIEWIGEILEAYDIEYETYAQMPERPNLLARVPGGDAPPLLLYGHLDVVPVTGQEWTHPPFEGTRADGHIWGRGALDMKSGVAMYLATFLRFAVGEDEPAGDILFLAVADEESGGDAGMRFLVEEHPALFEEVEFALGEFGAFEFDFAGIETYPIQTNEKQVCWLEATFRGRSGHASLPTPDTAMADMAEFVSAIESTRLPVHITPTVEEMIEAIAQTQPPEQAGTYRSLLDLDRTNEVLDTLGEEGRMLDALLHNTVNPTMVHGGDKENVVPEEISLYLDCRLVPGQTPADVIEELREISDLAVSFEIDQFDEGPPDADMRLFGLLEDAIDRETDGTAIPFLMFGGTDGRHLAKVGVQSYGFIPMQLGELPFLDLVHSGDERIPIETVEWGTDLVYDVVRRYDG